MHLARDLVAGDLGAAVRLDCIEAGCAIYTRFDDGNNARAPARVRHADDDRIEAVRMRLDRRLDLFWKDLLSARVDRNGTAAQQGDRSVRLERREVTGDRPALAAFVEHEHF